jgi:hypothetical protein
VDPTAWGFWLLTVANRPARGLELACSTGVGFPADAVSRLSWLSRANMQEPRPSW